MSDYAKESHAKVLEELVKELTSRGVEHVVFRNENTIWVSRNNRKHVALTVWRYKSGPVVSHIRVTAEQWPHLCGRGRNFEGRARLFSNPVSAVDRALELMELCILREKKSKEADEERARFEKAMEILFGVWCDPRLQTSFTASSCVCRIRTENRPASAMLSPIISVSVRHQSPDHSEALYRLRMENPKTAPDAQSRMLQSYLVPMLLSPLPDKEVEVSWSSIVVSPVPEAVAQQFLKEVGALLPKKEVPVEPTTAGPDPGHNGGSEVPAVRP